MQTRREFLLGGVKALGCWWVGLQVARRIMRLATEQRAPYLVEVPQPKSTLWANRQGDNYVLTLDEPYHAITVPELTWAEWFDLRGVDAENLEAVREHLIHWNCCDPDTEEAFAPPRLRDLVPGRLQAHYLQWDFVSREAPTARAYHYLAELELANRTAGGNRPLGALKFLDGTCPGNNSCLVLAEGVETLGGLHQRLLQLGEDVEVLVDHAGL